MGRDRATLDQVHMTAHRVPVSADQIHVTVPAPARTRPHTRRQRASANENNP